VAIFRDKNQSPLPQSLGRFAYPKLPAVQFLETLFCPPRPDVAHLIYPIYLYTLLPRQLLVKMPCRICQLDIKRKLKA
jgi:hypothetical protein